MHWSVLLLTFVAIGPLQAESRNRTPGFEGLPKGAAMVVMQPDIELFSLSAGGVQEPKADWTEAALTHVRAALGGKATELGLAVRELAESEADDLAEMNALHAAVARSIALHHITAGNFALPTKNGKLDWSLEDAVTPIREKTGGDFVVGQAEVFAALGGGVHFLR